MKVVQLELRQGIRHCIEMHHSIIRLQKELTELTMHTNHLCDAVPLEPIDKLAAQISQYICLSHEHLENIHKEVTTAITDMEQVVDVTDRLSQERS